MEEVVENISVPVSFGHVIKARRLSRLDTRSMVLTFALEVCPSGFFVL